MPWLSFGAASGQDAPVDFARDIRPILSGTCYKCHGPDESEREADFRLDQRDVAFSDRGGYRAIVPGKPDESELYRRITSDDPDEHMPPADSGKMLSPEQIALVRRWIEQGAVWKGHWAFEAPVRPALPALGSTKEAGIEWPRTAIDTFIIARLHRENLQPSSAAEPLTLLRRASLDLVGLPPSIDEIDAFIADKRPDAFERQVDRLLASPHYGERWGRHWLDAARYADSDGFEKDKPRDVWFYRDWVVGAMNRDLPYDQFIVDQIAGDLLPDATQDQIVATGFLRNSMINEEGGIDPEQFRMEAMFDRMDAVGKAMLGMTISCAQCHNHKFDPLTQRDYYRMFAFVNNSDEGSAAAYTGPDQQQRIEIFRQIRDVEAQLRRDNADWPERMAAWEASVRGDQPEWQIVRPAVDSSGGQKHYVLDDGSILAKGYAPTKHTTEFTVETDLDRITAVRLELLCDADLPRGGPGRSPIGLCALTEMHVVAGSQEEPGKMEERKITSATADANPPEAELAAIYFDKSDKRRVTGPIEYAIDGKDETAWGIEIGPGRSNVPRKAVFVLETPVEHSCGAVLTFKLTQNHGGWNSDDNQNNNLGRFRFSVTGAENPVADPLPAHVRAILDIPAEQRTPAQQAAVFGYWRTTVPEWKEANDRIEALWQEHPSAGAQLVLHERSQPRETHLLERGNFLKPLDVVKPGVPEFLHPLSDDLAEGESPTRLTFARWLADRRSPTTARSFVNRVWQSYFGIGIVATSEDLGMQSEAPSHPALLDWLAVELMDRGWSTKALHRRIVTSAAYRQSSTITPELLERDPYNRLVARGPRVRVEGEIVRDVALAASGLLTRRMGGPSVHPPAPDFLFVPPASYGPKTWKVDTGADRYRRALYTFRFRSVPYPVLQTFDTPNGDASCVRRARSNTPLQALATLNEPLFVECAQSLALQTVRESGDDESRLEFAFRRCLTRAPSPDEEEVLLAFLARQKVRFSDGKANPWDLAPGSADAPPPMPEGTTPAELAAWTALARVLLNLDETITKE